MHTTSCLVGIAASNPTDHFINEVMQASTTIDSVIGRGLRHKCTKETKFANIRSLLSTKEKEQIASEVIKQNIDKAGSSASISTRGSHLKVAIPPYPSRIRAPGQISASTLMTRMKNTRSSFRGLKEYQE